MMNMEFASVLDAVRAFGLDGLQAVLSTVVIIVMVAMWRRLGRVEREVSDMRKDFSHDLALTKSELGTQIADARKDFARELSDSRKDFARELSDTRKDFTREIERVRTEIADSRKDFAYAIDMLKSNDIEHLRTEMRAGFAGFKRQNEALLYYLENNKMLTSKDVDYIRSVSKDGKDGGGE